MLVAVAAMAVLVASACAPVSSQEASLQAVPAPESSAVVQQNEAETNTTAEAQADSSQSASDSDESDDPVAAVTEERSDGTDSSAVSASDRGSRTGADEVPAEPTTPPDPTENTTAGEDSSVAPGDDTTDSNESPSPASEGVGGTPTAIPTTAPLSTAEPVATAAPLATTAPAATAVPEPTATPTPTPVPPSADPDTAFTAPAPTGPVPSDDIVVQGPDVDESERVDISANGAAACAAAESAIDFLDRGDSAGTAAALQQAAEFAGQSSEPEIAGVAAQLAAAGADEEAAIAVIIATLNACAIHGYQV